MAETPNSKKRGFGFLMIKGSIFNIFKNGKKLHTATFYVCICNTIHSISVRFCVFAQKGVFNFLN